MDVKTYFDLHSRKKICWNKEKNVLLIVRAYHIQKNNTENLPITIRTYLSNNARIKKFFAYPDLKLKLCKGKKKIVFSQPSPKQPFMPENLAAKPQGLEGKGSPRISLSGAQLSWDRKLSWQVLEELITAPSQKEKCWAFITYCGISKNLKPEKVLTPPVPFSPIEWYTCGGLAGECNCWGNPNERPWPFYGPEDEGWVWGRGLRVDKYRVLSGGGESAFEACFIHKEAS